MTTTNIDTENSYISIPNFLLGEPNNNDVQQQLDRARGIVKPGPKSRKHGCNESSKEKLRKEVEKQARREYEELMQRCAVCHNTFKGENDRIKYKPANAKRPMIFCENCYEDIKQVNFETRYEKVKKKILDLRVQEKYGFHADQRGYAILDKKKREQAQ